MKDFVSILDLDATLLKKILADAGHLKALRREGKSPELLRGKNLAMIFEKSSTRTHMSFEVGMNELGGRALFMNAKDMQLSRGEEICDTARVASRYVQGVMIRAYRHGTIEEFARYAEIPVINGLSDREHPCQLLADIMTIRERFGATKGLRVAWIGDGNNVCNSLVLSSVITGMEIAVASPPKYRPSEDIVATARARGGNVKVLKEPIRAVQDAHVVVTDTWVSMGDETEREDRLREFHGYTVDASLVSMAAPDAIVMHCLPAHRGEEIAADVIEGERSAVWEEAENRLHAQKALLVYLMTRGD
jgi:ornithine carbamoyltransferase